MNSTVTNAIRFPDVTQKLGLGYGMNMPWGTTEIGFYKDPEVGETITPKMRAFFERYRDDFHYLFLAFQPKNRNKLRAEEYFHAYDELFAAVPGANVRAFHHTLLNLATLGGYDKRAILEFTNQLIDRYDFKWIVEDLGVWSIRGKVVPFPLPPYLTEEGLQACIRNIREYQEQLHAPLCFEFAGFTEGSNFHVGNGDAFDFFRRLAEETNSPITIDIGHILSYQWLKGRTGDRMYEGLERLPLDHCFEFHLSGCQIFKGKYRDLHHGVLLDEQIDLLAYLLPRCPNLKAVTYEDPKYTDEGVLVPKSQPNYHRLQELVTTWAEMRVDELKVDSEEHFVVNSGEHLEERLSLSGHLSEKLSEPLSEPLREHSSEYLDLESALYKLLHHRTYRQAFLEERYEQLQLLPEREQHLLVIDHEELEATAKRICHNLLRGDASEASKGLARSFPRALNLLQESGTDLLELMYRFVESDSFDKYREIPHAGVGICVEEAFYQYLLLDERFAVGSDAYFLLTHEFLNTLLAILVVNQDPAFAVETPLLHRNGTCQYALQHVTKQTAERMSNRTLGSAPDAQVTWLYAATARSFIGGPVSPFFAEALSYGSAEPLLQVQADMLQKYGMTEEAFTATLQKIGSMGLISC